MSLVQRVCPVCKSDDFDIVITLKQDHFTKNNPSYRIDRIPELDLDPHQPYPIVSCRQCRMVYTLYHLDYERESIVYGRIIDSKVSEAKVLTVNRRIRDLRAWLNLLALVKKSKSGKLDLRVMDYGCGWGTLLQVAQGPGVFAVGFDMTPWKIAWAREQGIPICESEEELMAYAPFDLGITTSVLEHLTEPQKAAEFIASCLKPGGYALITCIVGYVARPSGWEKVRKRLAQGLSLPKEINPWEHLNYFTPRTLAKLLMNSGFVPVDPPGHWITEDSGARQYARIVLDMLQKYLPLGWPKVGVSKYWQLKDA